MTFGQRLSSLRKEKGYTQNQLADLIGVSRGTVGMYEIDKRNPDTATLKELSSLFNVSIDYILGITNIKKPHKYEDYDITQEELEFLVKIKSDPELSILFHDLKDAPNKKIRQFIKTWKFVKEQFDEGDKETR